MSEQATQRTDRVDFQATSDPALLAGTNRGNVMGWRLSDGKLVARQTHGSYVVDALTLFADGRYFLTETEHGQARVWRLPNMEVVADLENNDLRQVRAADQMTPCQGGTIDVSPVLAPGTHGDMGS